MDTWGTGSFENDAAAAFIHEVVEDGVAALAEAFEVALDPDAAELEAEEGARVVAAAEIVQAHLTGDTENVTNAGLRAWMDELQPDELADLRPLALEALDRVVGPGSELPDAWEESLDASEWIENVQRLRASLGGGIVGG
ncbi:DUF4259 domain-containing protein [Deinococcus sp. KNUC1210]|uniref:DUF4259 domain-containing protein n=1 Tax=Deinococcus sp. KNUC1210 TaxID=2917691 RepID=UPI001EEF8BD6|nr:DUF4259 domain-containing protein [Deinococcus sp. KNUC1210]ULH16149.1 DUF4259 domain-containing protein [Deinococcus sp. KNUC1210]